MFIRPPFITCPFCQENSFGVLTIHQNNYTRRCENCGRPSGYEKANAYALPQLNKKIVYLDQFVVSGIARNLFAKPDTDSKIECDEYLTTIYNKISRLSKRQQIVSPDSSAHRDESLLAKNYDVLKKTYEGISFGISFKNFHSIKRNQLFHNAKNWFDNSQDEYDYNPKYAIHGKINAWQGKFRFAPSGDYWKDTIEPLKNAKEEFNRRISKPFKRWQTENNISFVQRFEEESMSFGRSIIKIYVAHLKNLKKKSDNNERIEYDEFLGHLCIDFVLDVTMLLEEKGLSGDAVRGKVFEYFYSTCLRDIPFVKIESMLWAAIACKVSDGQKRIPQANMSKDIEIISVLLPYCDAMFLDKECHSLLIHNPIGAELNYNTELFSYNNKEKFIEYLDEIEAGITDEHYNALLEVYGKDYII